MTHYLTHCGPVTRYGDIDLGQHWFRQWLVAWRHQAIAYNINVAFTSMGFYGKFTRSIHESLTHNMFGDYTFKITNITISPRDQWVNAPWYSSSAVETMDCTLEGASNIVTLTHWPLGDLKIFFKMSFSNSYPESIPWAIPAKLLSEVCHRTPLMISQHWFR